jgi:uncharacterized Ntn-hydrolase superfamily protein
MGPHGGERHFATMSIVVRDPHSAAFGAAIASGIPAVGAFCLFADQAAGMVATQAWTNPYLGPDILERLRAGTAPAEALNQALGADPGAERRQVGVVGLTGAGAARTGAETTGWSGHLCGEGIAVQGNMLAGPEVPEALMAGFLESRGDELADRLLASLAAGQAAGGDRRGLESAALLITSPEIYAATDLRVDFHFDPVRELGLVLEAARKRLLPSLPAMPTRDNPLGDVRRMEELAADDQKKD